MADSTKGEFPMTEIPKTTIMKTRRVVEERWLELDRDAAQEVLAEMVEDFDSDNADDLDDADEDDDDEDDDAG